MVHVTLATGGNEVALNVFADDLRRLCRRFQYHADAGRFSGERRPFEVIGRESSVLFEPGKCIKCELCVKIAAGAKEPLGLSFVGRGFDVQLGVPFDGTMEEALGNVARQCIDACPTAAIRFAKTELVDLCLCDDNRDH